MTVSSVPIKSGESHEFSGQECEERVQELQELVVHLSTAGPDASAVSAAMHEVAQPVTAATNYLASATHLLSSGDPEANDRGLEAVGFAQQCLTRTGEVMANVKAKAEMKPFAPDLLDLRSIVTEALQLFEFDTATVVSIEISPAASRAMGDRVQLGQVMSNLIRNAIEATEGQAVRLLRITTRRLDPFMIEVRLEDNGPGIAEKMRGLIFSAICSTKGGGAGVGLSICRTIIEQHNGQIWADALPLGTAFCFSLPSCPELPINGSRRRTGPTEGSRRSIGQTGRWSMPQGDKGKYTEKQEAQGRAHRRRL